MKITITETMFKDAFAKAGRKDQFSYEGLTALFGYIEELEEYGEELELDVIALCCEFSEYDSASGCVMEHRGTLNNIGDKWTGYTDAELEEECSEYLRDNTHVIEFDGGIIIQSF